LPTPMRPSSCASAAIARNEASNVTRSSS
jgi:hypothetical protein